MISNFLLNNHLKEKVNHKTLRLIAISIKYIWEYRLCIFCIKFQGFCSLYSSYQIKKFIGKILVISIPIKWKQGALWFSSLIFLNECRCESKD